MLLVDAHYEPARFRGAAAAANPSLLDNLGSRQQANDVAFGKVGRYPFSACVPEDPDGDPYELICNRFGKPQGGQAVHRREDLVSGVREPAGSRSEGSAVLP